MLKPKKKVKITKKDLKEDQFILTVLKVQEYLAENIKVIAGALGGAILIVVLATYIVTSSAARNSEAAAKLTEASYMLSQGNEEALNMLVEITDKYGDTEAAVEANFKLAKKYWQDGNYVQAKTYFQNVVDEGSDVEMILAASYAGLADCYFAEKDFAKAAELYEKAGNESVQKERKASFYYSSAMALQQIPDQEGMKKMLKKIADEYKGTSYTARAERLLAALK